MNCPLFLKLKELQLQSFSSYFVFIACFSPNKKAGEEPDDDIRSNPSLYIFLAGGWH